MGVPPSTLAPPSNVTAEGGGPGSAVAVAGAVADKVEGLVKQLPADFFQPLVAQGSLDAGQVGTWGRNGERGRVVGGMQTSGGLSGGGMP